MRKAVAAAMLTIALGGCATWHRPGTPKSIMENDLARCDRKATQIYPPVMVTVQASTGYWDPATQQCRQRNGYTYCQEYPATWTPPAYTQRDRNAPARRAWVRSCMRASGYHQ